MSVSIFTTNDIGFKKESQTFSPSGLRNGGLITEVTINDSSWTALPAVALSGRNAISIQNRSGFEVKLNYTSSAGYVGMVVPDQYERHYDITDAISIYARAISGAGSVVVIIEEIS